MQRLLWAAFLFVSLLAAQARGAIPCVRAIAVSSKALAAGSATTGTVTLTSTAPAGGLVVQLSSSTDLLEVVTSVTVPEGKTSSSFHIQARDGASDVRAKITATAGDCAGASAAIAIVPPTTSTPCVSAVTISAASVVGGGGLNGTVLLSGPAPANGTAVNLQSTSAAVNVNSTLNIPAGQSSGGFSVSTTSVGASTLASVQASAGPCGMVSASLTVNPVASLAAVSLSSSIVRSGTSISGTLLLSGPAPGSGVTVSLRSSSLGLIVPFAVTIPAGQASAMFQAQAGAVTADTSAEVSAWIDGGGTRTATVQVQPL